MYFGNALHLTNTKQKQVKEAKVETLEVLQKMKAICKQNERCSGCPLVTTCGMGLPFSEWANSQIKVAAKAIDKFK